MAAIGQTRPLGVTNMRTPLFIFGVALALVAFLAMFAFGIVFVGRSAPTGTVPVVVAKANIDARTPISADMLTLTPIAAAAVPPNAFLHIADLTGLVAIVQIYKGEAISANLVVANADAPAAGSPSAYLPIPKGMVAMALPTSEQQGVAGYIAQGDYIDVIATMNTSLFSPTSPRTVTHMVFTNLHIIRVGPQSLILRQGQAQGIVISVTVVMWPCDAQYMEWLLINATLKYTLLAYPDYQTSASDSNSSSCSSSSELNIISPAQVDARWHFQKG